MDDVLEKFKTVTTTDSTEQDEPKSGFEDLYKYWGRLGNQEERRKDLLVTQKTNRSNKLDGIRGILDLVSREENSKIFSNSARYRPTIYAAGFVKVSQNYKDVLMLSEWMIEKPKDFNENWYVVPCPKGIRMLLVAYEGSTKCYTKYGHFRFELRTMLPGGNPISKGKNRCCVLDCFYHENTKTMYILDLLAWNSQPMTDGETEFRRYWLVHNLFDIMPDLRKLSKNNKLLFELLPMKPCTPDSLKEFMMKYPMFKDDSPKLDGLLFYHKHGQYVSGETPLVGWLFPFMVSEILGDDIEVHHNHMLQKPVDYVNQATYIKKFEQKYSKRKMNRHTSMDTAEDEDKDDQTSDEIEANGQKLKTIADCQDENDMDTAACLDNAHTSVGNGTESPVSKVSADDHFTEI